MKKNWYFNYIAVLMLILSLGISACSQYVANNLSSPIVNKVPGTYGDNSHSDEAHIDGSSVMSECGVRVIRGDGGQRLFRSSHFGEDNHLLRQQFLQTEPVRPQSLGIFRFNVNTARGPSYQPKSPVVFTYHGVGVRSFLTVSFSEVFRENIPIAIRDVLMQHNVNTLDIIFTQQDKVGGDQVSLKPAFWMFPNRPKMDDVLGSPPELSGCVLMRLFESDQNIEDQVSHDQLKPFQNFFHDQRLSPDTGHLNISEYGESFSFYSLVIFEAQQRAAVTLHWLLNHNDSEALSGLLKNKDATRSFGALMDALNIHNRFQGTPMLQKLNGLIK